jgi:HK97 family phage portal protein
MSFVTDFWQRIRIAFTAARAWKAGAGVVDPFERYYGHDDSKYTPSELGDYLTTSNAIYTCATIRADALALLEFKAIRLANGKPEEVKEGPEIKLLRKVNDFWTMNRLLAMTELSLCLWGKCFWAVERGANGKGEPREIWWMKPDRVSVITDAVDYIKGYAYTPINGAEAIAFLPGEVIWLRYPNPLDEFGALSPMMTVRLPADVGTSAAKSNKHIFDNGLQMGGVVVPKTGATLTPDQAKEIELMLEKRFKGVDKFHRWGVFRFEAEMKQMGVTPHDAEFLGALNWTLEEACRAFKVPLDMVGGQRTYENVEASDRALWMRAMVPESIFIASELTEQLLPMFQNTAVELIEPGYRHVLAMQDDEGEQWTRENQQIEKGAITINEWRGSKGMDKVAWGDAWWAPLMVTPIKDGTPPPGAGIKPAPTGGAATQGKGRKPNPKPLPGMGRGGRMIEFGSEEHERLWQRFTRRTDRQEGEFKKLLIDLFERQKESIIAKLKQRVKIAQGNGRTIEDVIKEPFDMAQWIKEFRIKGRLSLKAILKETGEAALEDLGLSITFDILEPNVVRFLERRAQRFAKEVNETTWQQLKDSLSEGMKAGEGIEELAQRVEMEMAGRIESDSETISRTEVIGANNGGTLLAWEQTEVVSGKTWLAALDERTRETHIEAHQRYQNEPIGIDEDFEVGAGSGPAPGQIGLPEEDISCRCTMTAVLKTGQV